jgi:signal transduction histidine kinase/ActR/RegA family two-component response regulator
VLCVLAILGFVANQQTQSRAGIMEAARRQMWRLDMVLAEQTGRAVETVDFILRDAIEEVSPANPGALPNAAQLRRRIQSVRQMRDIDVTDAAGAIIVSSRDMPGTVLPPAGLTALERHRNDPSPGLQFSEPLRDAAGAWTMLATRRISRPDSGFAGIGVAWINLTYFEEFYKAVELAENGAILLHRRDGLVLARYPEADQLIGTSYAQLPPFRDILSTSIAGTVDMESPIDGTLRILAIRALRAFPLAVNISIGADRVLADWRRETRTYGFVGSVIATAVAFLLFKLAARYRQVETLLTASGAAQEQIEASNQELRTEIAERARAEAALQQAQRLEVVGQLTGGVAHDFNNLLTVVLGHIEMLETNNPSAQQTTSLATMRSAAERAATLTIQLLAFARRQPLQPRPVDIAAMISGMITLLQSAVGSRTEVSLDLDPKTGFAMVDPTQIELIILNLAINARDAMPQGGTLRISCTQMQERLDSLPALAKGAYVRIDVADDGTGMTPEVLTRAFEPFFTTKAPGDGSGLGLSQVYGVVRQLGGHVQIDSTEGEGTLVALFLPAAAAPDLQTPRSLREQPPSTAARVLLVDDNRDVRRATAMLLRKSGYDLIEADGGATALALIEVGEKIDLLLTDVVMPNMNGAELAAQARAQRPDLPVMFISGYADPDEISGAMARHTLLRKPYRASELRAAIEAALITAASLSTQERVDL